MDVENAFRPLMRQTKPLAGNTSDNLLSIRFSRVAWPKIVAEIIAVNIGYILNNFLQAIQAFDMRDAQWSLPKCGHVWMIDLLKQTDRGFNRIRWSYRETRNRWICLF